MLSLIFVASSQTPPSLRQYLATVGRPKGGPDAFQTPPPLHRATSSSFTGKGGGHSLLPPLPPSSSPVSSRLSVEKRVLDSNPILEAFGNAKTLRNENSSRFGKFIALQFNSRGELIGAKINVYLLEKVRVGTQQEGERNYHIFYQLLAGASPDEKARWGLKSPRHYRFLNQSTCTTLKEVSDAEEFAVTRSAMATMGIAGEDAEGLLATLAGLLHLSNVTFDEPKAAAGGGKGSGAGGSPGGASMGPGGRGSPGGAAASSSSGAGRCRFSPGSAASVELAAKLLDVPLSALEDALTQKESFAGSERFTTFFTAAQSQAALEAVAKNVYGRLFLWLVHAINRRIKARVPVAHFIGVLDIFGEGKGEGWCFRP